MRVWIAAALLLVLVPAPAHADGRVQGWCEDGNYTVTMSGGGTSTNRYQRSFPSCTVTVFLAGTVTPATIYADDDGTVKANPFTAANTGRWFFYAPDGRYDVRFSGGGIPAPFTLGDVSAFDTSRPANIRIPCAAEFAGANAGAKIIQAIADLPSTGGTVDASCFEGAQTISSTINMNKRVKLLLGAATFTFTGSTAIFRMSSDSSSIEGIGADVSIVVGNANVDGILLEGDDVVLKDFTIRGPGRTPNNAGFIGIDHSGTGQDNVTIQNMIIEDWASIGLNGGTLQSRNWKLIHNVVRRNNQAGIQSNQAMGWLIDGNTITGNGSNGIDINGQRMRIVNNYIYENGDLYLVSQPFDTNGIVITSVNGNALENLVGYNQIYNNSSVGIRIRADGKGLTEHTQVIGNEVWGHGHPSEGHGIILDVSVGPTCGILNDTIISNNNVHDNARVGIGIIGGAGTPCVVNRTMISGNSVTGNGGDGIFPYWGDHAQITGNIVTGNNGGGSQITLGGSLATGTLVFCNLTDPAVNECRMQNGVFVTDTIRGGTNPAVTINAPNNAALILDSDNPTIRSYALVAFPIDSFCIFDYGPMACRIQINNNGQVEIPNTLYVSGGELVMGGTLFAALGTPDSGTFKYCPDCTRTDPCATGGDGAWAKRLGGVWKCD